MASSAPLSYAEDSTLFLYTSLTAGSSHIITATSRLETILKANKIPFQAIDIATNEKARMIWGRRSRNRKLPGLVKYAQVIGVSLHPQRESGESNWRPPQDLEQIEEWNEYGELKEQIDDTSAGEPIAIRPAAPAAPARDSAPPSRDSSQGRHISISEPTKSADRNPAAALDGAESPMAMAMRQAGAEAASKAGQKKILKPMPTAPTPSEKDTTAPVVEPKIASPMADPSTDPEMTQAKSPAQLAAEGVRQASAENIEKSPDANGTVSGGLEPPVSNEQQVADLRRTSSIAKAPSKLSETQTYDPVPEEASEPKDEQKFEERPKTHRGSSLSQASREEIRDVEKRNSIAVDPTEDEEAAIGTAGSAAKIGATDAGEKPASEDIDHEKSDAKNAEGAGISVGD